MDKAKQLTPEELESRERIIAHGLVGIQMKPEQLRKLFELSDQEGVKPNILARRWILQRMTEDIDE